MERKHILMLVAAGMILLGIAGALLIFSSGEFGTPTPTPTPRPPLPQVEIKLPPSLEELAAQYPDIAPILNAPELATAYKDFLVAYQQGGVEAALTLAKTRGLLTPDEQYVRVTLVLDTEDSALLVQELESLGVRVASAYQDRVNVAVPVPLIQAQLQSEQPGAIFLQLTQLEHVIAVRLPDEATPYQGAVLGEGVALINADTWHQAGVTGAGLRIGVLDLGFAGYEDLLGVELPGEAPLAKFGWYDEGEVHGTACAEIVHEVAPGADLVFAWYDGSEAAMGEAVAWLLEQDVDIITHSAGALAGPRDGSGWKSRLIDDVAAQGILWVNAAGNEAQKHYRAVFTDADGNGIHEFAPGEEMLALYNRGQVLIFLQWEDSWKNPTRDYELYLMNADGDVLASSEDPQSGEAGQRPLEGISYFTGGDTVYAVVTVYESDTPVTFDIFIGGGMSIDYTTPSYSLSTPADAFGSLTVGAVNWWDDRLASYSSQGPTADERLKPELSAPAGVSGQSYGRSAFDGTSAATPHVAAAAALVWQANPHFTRQEVMDYLIAMSTDLGPPGPDTGYGYGRLSLPDQVPAIAATPISDTPAPTPESSVPTATPAPLPTPTPVTFVTPEPVGGGGRGDTDLIGQITLVGLLILGMGCCGAGLLGVSVLLLIIGSLRRKRRAQAARQAAPPPAQRAAPPPSSRPPVAPPAAPLPECPACGAPLRRPDAQFCTACGHTLRAPAGQPRRCTHCGADLREGARFCNRCGRQAE